MLEGKATSNVESSDSLLDKAEKQNVDEGLDHTENIESGAGPEDNSWSEDTKVYLRGVLTRTLLTGVVLLIAIYLVSSFCLRRATFSFSRTFCFLMTPALF